MQCDDGEPEVKPVEQNLGQVVLVVKEYDEAIEYFTRMLGFELLEDKEQPGKRWVVVKPSGIAGASLLLARAKNARETEHVGGQTGGRVAFFLYTDDFWRDYARMKDKGVDFIEEPRDEEYGLVVVFRDLYGNKWDFIQRRQ